MSEQAVAMLFAGFGVVGMLVSWVFYIVVGKSLWDMRQFFRRTPGDYGKGQGQQGDRHAERKSADRA